MPVDETPFDVSLADALMGNSKEGDNSEPELEVVEKAFRSHRQGAIGMFPPPKPNTFDLAEPGMFCSEDETVINWSGDDYYLGCGSLVSRLPDGGQSHCVKRINHTSQTHEDFEGRIRDAMDLGLGVMSLEEAVFSSLGAASMCWQSVSETGIFQSDRAKEIGEQLMVRIRQAGPIYD